MNKDITISKKISGVLFVILSGYLIHLIICFIDPWNYIINYSQIYNMGFIGKIAAFSMWFTYGIIFWIFIYDLIIVPFGKEDESDD